jgi:hypothetical protein
VTHIVSILEKLAKAQAKFLRMADRIPSDQWTRRPSDEAWSAAEVVAHLVLVERAIVGVADRVAQNAPQPAHFLRRLHLPLWLMESRIMRRSSPIPLDPSLLQNPSLLHDKEEMLGQLRATRERAIAFLEETRKRDVRCYRWRHVFLGSLNAHEWFERNASHQLRHSKQVQEIRERLPKVVGISQNQ